MGQKVNPVGLRLGINRTWDSRWVAGRGEYGRMLHEDIKIREYLRERLQQAGVSRIVIERPAKKARVTIHTARPGVVIGKKGADIELIRKDLQKMTGNEVSLNIIEIRKPELDAALVAENIAQQLERRVAFPFDMVDGQLAPLEVVETLAVPLDRVNHDSAGTGRRLAQGAHRFEHRLDARIVVWLPGLEERADHVDQDQCRLFGFGHHAVPLARDRRVATAIIVNTTITIA